MGNVFNKNEVPEGYLIDPVPNMYLMRKTEDTPATVRNRTLNPDTAGVEGTTL